MNAVLTPRGLRRSCAVLCMLVAPASRAPGQEDALSCSVPDVILGTIEPGDSLEHEFVLENRSRNAVTIRRLKTTCAQATLALASSEGGVELGRDGATELVLRPGDEARVTVRVDTTGLEDGLRVRRMVLVYTPDAGAAIKRLFFEFRTPEVDVTRRATVREEDDEDVREEEARAEAPRAVPESAPRIQLDVNELDLGILLAGEKKSKSISLRNAGASELEIQRIESSCGCTVPRIVTQAGETVSGRGLDPAKPLRIGPGGEARLEVEFDSAGRSGAIRKSVKVYSNDPAAPVLSLAVKATCEPGYVAEPELFDFGEPIVSGHRTTKRSVVVTLFDGENVEDVKVNAPGLEARWERLPLRPDDGERVRARYRIDVSVGSEAPRGRLGRVVSVLTDGPRVSTIRIPLRAQITGVIQFKGANPARPASFDFGLLRSDEAVTLDMDVLNHDPAEPYRVRRVSIESRQAEHVRAELETRTDGVAYTLHLTALPSLPAAGFSGIVVLESDHPGSPVERIPFRGWKRLD